LILKYIFDLPKPRILALSARALNPQTREEAVKQIAYELGDLGAAVTEKFNQVSETRNSSFRLTGSIV